MTGRRLLVPAGLLVLAAVWLGPLPSLARSAFFAHMTMHVSVVALAAPFLAVGLAGSALDPVRRLPRLFAPIPASALELVVVWGWHAPALHLAARERGAVLVLEQGTFLLAGLLVWLSAFGGSETERHQRAGVGVIGLLLTSMHMTLLGALLALALTPIYHRGASGGGLGPLEDQHLGGALMLVGGGTSYLVGGLALMATLLRGRAAQPSRKPR